MERTFENSKTSFISRVMTNMGLGLFVTFITAFLVANNETLLTLLLGSRFNIFILFLVEIGLVIYLTRRIGDMSLSQARFAFLIYAVVNGITLSTIFLAYNITTIYTVFLIASIMFIAAGFVGISVKKDLSAFGHFMIMALIGLILVSIINIFLRAAALDTAISFIGVMVFSGLTAYDMQKIKGIHYNAYRINSEDTGKYAIIGALTLYLDFINLFLYLLRLLGRRR
jgi:FtsH-binding integral membrane protein